jgi:iron complex outermembrane receptor protein
MTMVNIKLRVYTLLLLLISVIFSLVPPSQAQEQANASQVDDTLVSLDIPSMDLVDALLAFTDQSGTNIIAKWDILSEYRSSPLVGPYHVETALSLLLARTNIDFEYRSSDRTILLKEKRLDSKPLLIEEKRVAVQSFMEEVIVAGIKPRVISSSPLDIPISSTIYEGGALESLHVSSFSDIERVAPSIMFASGSRKGRGEIGIRGVGLGAAGNSGNIGTNVRVPVYVDDVPTGRFSSLNQDLTDIQQIEILRGPQGALFGANTIVGAIKIITKKPDNELKASVSSELGNTAYRKNWFSINVPFSEEFFFSTHFSQTQSNGFVYNNSLKEDIQGNKREAGRIKFRYLGVEGLDLNLSFDGLEEDSKSINGVLMAQPDANGFVLDTQILELDTYETDHNAQEFQNRRVYGSSLNIDYKLGDNMRLSYIAGFRDNKFSELNDEDFSHFDALISTFNEESQQQSHEMKFTSQLNDSFNYVFGVTYLEEEIRAEPRLVIGREALDLLQLDFPSDLKTLIQLGYTFNIIKPEETVLADSIGNVDSRSMSTYLHMNYSWTDALNIGLSLRYVDDDKTIDYQLKEYTGFSGLSKTIDDEFKNQELLPMLGFNYDRSESVSFFGNVAKGYKSGGWNADMIVDFDAFYFGEESAISYELGAKATVFDGLLSFDVTGFKTKFEDFQIFSPTKTFELVVNPEFIIVGEKASTQGIELNSKLFLGDNFTFSSNLAYTEAKFDQVKGEVERDSDKMFFAPPWSAYLALDYYASVFNTTEFYVNLNYTYVGKNNSLTRFTHEIPSRYTVNLNASLNFSDKLHTTFWLTNATNESNITRWSTSFFGLERGSYQEPRTFGATLKYLFD